MEVTGVPSTTEERNSEPSIMKGMYLLQQYITCITKEAIFLSVLLNQGPHVLCLMQHCLFRQIERTSCQHGEFSSLSHGFSTSAIQVFNRTGCIRKCITTLLPLVTVLLLRYECFSALTFIQFERNKVNQ